MESTTSPILLALVLGGVCEGSFLLKRQYWLFWSEVDFFSSCISVGRFDLGTNRIIVQPYNSRIICIAYLFYNHKNMIVKVKANLKLHPTCTTLVTEAVKAGALPTDKDGA